MELPDKPISVDGIDVHIRIERFKGSVRVLYLSIADTEHNINLNKTPDERYISLLTNSVGKSVHDGKYFEIDQIKGASALECLIAAGYVTKSRSVVFTNNGAINVYQLEYDL